MKNYFGLLVLLLCIISCTDENVYQDETIDQTTILSRSLEIENIEAVCGTIDTTPPPAWFFMRDVSTEATTEYTKEYQFKVFLHIIRNTDGTATYGDVDNMAVNTAYILNEYYKNLGISFLVVGTEYIDSDAYNKIPYSYSSNIFSKNPHTDAIDIYIITGQNGLKKSNGVMVYGSAQNIPSTAFWICATQYQTASLVHEMGHCLGLYHTHHGTATNKYAETDGTPELVNGSNSVTAGDFIKDTPADPCIWSNGTYAGNSSNVDANGDCYIPDPCNFMSYSGTVQSQYFTPYQVKRIINTIESNYMLYPTYNIIEKIISGPRYIENSGTYSIDCSDVYNVTWNVTCETFTSSTGSASSTYTESHTGNSFTLVNRDVNACSQKYTIDLRVDDLTGFIKTSSFTVYHVSPSEDTGLFRWSSESDNGDYLGEIDIASSGTGSDVIKIHQGGTLYFYYSDASGAYSYTDQDYFNFQMVDGNSLSVFTPVNNTNHAFTCSESAPVGSFNMTLFLTINGILHTYSIPVQILGANSTQSIEFDSTLVQEIIIANALD